MRDLIDVVAFTSTLGTSCWVLMKLITGELVMNKRAAPPSPKPKPTAYARSLAEWELLREEALRDLNESDPLSRTTPKGTKSTMPKDAVTYEIKIMRNGEKIRAWSNGRIEVWNKTKSAWVLRKASNR